MIALALEEITRRFITASGETYTAVENVTLEVPAGRFISVVGPSGCGKSTLLNVAAGLIAPSSGQVRVYGERLRGINRRAGYMFQQDALLPWKTVLENVLLGPLCRGRRRREVEEEAFEWLKRVGLEGFAGAYPYQLSGGMRKRVAMAQNWIADPAILFMDEPFTALDIHTRQLMESELLQLWSASRKSVLFVTHDLEEAIALSDEVVVLSAGPASRVINRYAVGLERPRNLIDLRMQPAFLDIYSHIWADLREQVLRSHERLSIA
jgi:NitT/TauT family transport system ATP-binding protein